MGCQQCGTPTPRRLCRTCERIKRREQSTPAELESPDEGSDNEDTDS